MPNCFANRTFTAKALSAVKLNKKIQIKRKKKLASRFPLYLMKSTRMRAPYTFSLAPSISQEPKIRDLHRNNYPCKQRKHLRNFIIREASIKSLPNPQFKEEYIKTSD